MIEVFVDDTDEEEVFEEAKLEESSAADRIVESAPYFLMVPSWRTRQQPISRKLQVMFVYSLRRRKGVGSGG